MTVTALARPFDCERYNALVPVEAADRIVRANNALGEMLSRAGVLFVKHGMQSRFGMALLHRHHTCHVGERMTQAPGRVNDESALVTQPLAAGTHHRPGIPWVWSVSEGEFYPMEFTTDSKAERLYHDPANVPEAFLNEFVELVTASPIGHLLGLAVVERAFYDTIPAESIAVEYSNIERRASIVLARERHEVSNTIETTWAFEAIIDPMLGCESQSACVTVCKCECIDDAGTHSHIHFDRHRTTPGQHNPT